MLAPGKDGARLQPPSPVLEGTQHIFRNLRGILYFGIGFSLVHRTEPVRGQSIVRSGSFSAGLQPFELCPADPPQAGQTSFELAGDIRPAGREKQIEESGTDQSNRVMDSKRDEKAELGHAAVMLPPILPGRPVQLQIEAQWGVRRTGPAIVNRSGFCKENDSLARLVEAVAPVHIFSIHEELRIKRADAIKRATANHDEPAVQHFDRRSRPMVKI